MTGKPLSVEEFMEKWFIQDPSVNPSFYTGRAQMKADLEEMIEEAIINTSPLVKEFEKDIENSSGVIMAAIGAFALLAAMYMVFRYNP